MWEDLANAIVETACKDYIFWYKNHLKHPEYENCNYNLAKLDKFFKSEYFELLCQVNGSYLIRELRKHTEKKLYRISAKKYGDK